VVFGMFAGINYWFPKATGFKLDVFWGKVSFWLWVIGFWVAFTPLYVLGLMGVTRRLRHFDDPSLQVWFVIAAIGALLILGGILAMLIQIGVSIRDRERLRDLTGDPWDARTLEWSTASPPPAYNFAFTPVIHDHDAWSDMKKRGYVRPLKGYAPIHMPKNTGAGVILAGLSLVCAVALIWYVWWLAAISFVAILTVAIGHSFDRHRDYHIPAQTVVETEAERTRLLRMGA
jgi:cytochrome o ubiquinol oxidase subunit 1